MKAMAAQRRCKKEDLKKAVALNYLHATNRKQRDGEGNQSKQYWKCDLCQDEEPDEPVLQGVDPSRIAGHLNHKARKLSHCPQSHRINEHDKAILMDWTPADALQTARENADAASEQAAGAQGPRPGGSVEPGNGSAVAGGGAAQGVATQQSQVRRQASLMEFDGPNAAADSAVIRFLVANGVPLKSLDSPEFQAMVSEIKNGTANWRPPKRTKAREKLLPQECERLKARLETVVQDEAETGFTLMSDGAQDRKKRQLINYLLSTGAGTFFIGFEEFNYVSKTGAALGESMCNMMSGNETFQPRHVQLVLCDNAAAEQSALRSVQACYPWVERAGCAAHGLDLVLEDIGKERDVKYVLTLVTRLSRWILNNHQYVTLLQDQGAQVRPIRPITTRFGSNLAMLRRFVRIHGPLSRLLNSDEIVAAAQKKGLGHVHELDHLRNRIFPKQVRERRFLERAKAIVRVMWPVHKLLRDVDSGAKMTDKIYHRMSEAVQEVRSVDDTGMKLHPEGSLSERAAAVLEQRWNSTIHCDLHAAGYALNVLYINHTLEDAGEVREGLERVVRRYYHDDGASYQAAINEFDLFRKKRAPKLFDPLQLKDLQSRYPFAAWKPLAKDFPHLAPVGKRSVSQPVAASKCEHIWSATDFFHTPQRNSLTVDSLSKLVYLKHNLNTMPLGSSKDGLVQAEWEEDARQAPSDCDAVPLSEEEEQEEEEELGMDELDNEEADETAVFDKLL